MVLIRYKLETAENDCITCDLDFGETIDCVYTDADITPSGDTALLSCLGPSVPSYHVITLNKSNQIYSLLLVYIHL